jgi:hypothetical protein
MAQYELPENLSALSDDELNAALNEGLDAFKDLGLTAESDEDTIAEGERIAPLVQAVRAEQQARVAAAESRAQRAAELLATVPEQTAEVTEVEEAVSEEPVAEVEVEEEAPTTTIENEESVVSDNIPEPVAASAAQSPVARAAANTPETVVPRRAAAVLTASADVSGFAAGQELDDLGQVGAALVARLRTLPKMPSSVSVMQRFGAAQIRKTGYGALVQDAGMDDYSLMQRAGEESRLSGGSLVAAGGWCAPAETVWDMCSLEVVDGILDLPEVNITRGGIRYTRGPDFSTIYNQCGFHQRAKGGTGNDKDQFFNVDAAGVLQSTDCKECCKVECPPWEEVPLEAIGLCIKADILTNHAWPELVRRHIEGALVAHAHKVNKFLLAQMAIEAGGAGKASILIDPTASFALDGIEWEAVAMREKWHLGENATIEVVLPQWYKVLVKIDVARRNGQDWNTVTDAQVQSSFNARNLRVQWVQDLQPLTQHAFGDTKPTAVPPTASGFMYPAGTWAKGGSDIISLDAVYDSVGLEGNVYTGLFVEESILALQRCTETLAFTVKTCADGLTGPQGTACLGAAVTAP